MNDRQQPPQAGPGPATADTAGQEKWRRRGILALVFLLGILLGWLLAPRSPGCPGGATGDSRVSGPGAAVHGTGPGAKVGLGNGTGSGGGGFASASGDTHGRGYDGDATGAGGTAGGGGGGKGTTDSGNGGTLKSRDAEDSLRTAVIRGASADSPDGGGQDKAPPADVAGKVLSAPDFTYDRTGLPRYAGAVQAVQSALVYSKASDTSDYGSSAGIVTGDSFDTVVAWYKAQLPPGWQSESIADLNQVQQQFSVENIGKMLSAAGAAAAAGAPAPTPAAGAQASDPAAREAVALFKAPPGTAGKPGILIAQHGEQPVTVLLSARSTP
jgi:hypothetical protein